MKIVTERIHFSTDVSAELREYLMLEYDRYAENTAMTDNEHQALCEWIAEGNSPYSNPSLIADERGMVMDFISGRRITEDMMP